MKVHGISGPNALAVEHQAMYRDAQGNLRLANGIDHSDPLRPSSVFGPRLFEKVDDLGLAKTRVLPNDRPDPLVVRAD